MYHRCLGTYTGEGDTAVTALGSSASLLQVVVHQLATRGLDDTPLVRGGVVGGALADGDSLGHGGRYKRNFKSEFAHRES